ncbi:MAG: hypothetical protein AAFY71_08465 [Bacteroidota bacterium]
MPEPIDIKKRTEFFIRDLHARENMRLGWYRQFGFGAEKTRYLRERKAHHIAFLRDLLRKRGLGPVWYARMFYLLGHGFGFFSGFLPRKFLNKIEDTLESWILLRYRKYLKEMKLDSTLRSMIESLQLKRLNHNEPAPEVMNLIEHYVGEQEKVLEGERPHAFGHLEITV